MRTLSLRSWSLVVALVIASASQAHAQELDDQTRSAARELATEGSALYQQGDFEGASDRFKRAYLLVQRPNVGIWAARSLARAGHLVEASERYLELERSKLPEGAPPDQARAVEDAARERRELLGRLPSVKVLVEGADPGSVFVSLNGRVVNAALIGAKQPVDPGKLLVKGVRGEQTVEASVELAEGQFREVRLAFTPVAAGPVPSAAVEPGGSATPLTGTAPPREQPGSRQRLFGFIGIGVGGALLATGVVAGALAASDRSALDQGCPERRCPPELHDKNDAYGVKKTVSSVGIIGGAALAGAGLVLVLTAPTATPATQGVRLHGYVTASGVGLLGAF